ncbi:MAG: hypothetical protein JW861_11280 [Bacteroidales bacterium]|nr:hypothetical protein [Bacteroidales bacterium]
MNLVYTWVLLFALSAALPGTSDLLTEGCKGVGGAVVSFSDDTESTSGQSVAPDSLNLRQKGDSGRSVVPEAMDVRPASYTPESDTVSVSRQSSGAWIKAAASILMEVVRYLF